MEQLEREILHVIVVDLPGRALGLGIGFEEALAEQLERAAELDSPGGHSDEIAELDHLFVPRLLFFRAAPDSRGTAGRHEDSGVVFEPAGGIGNRVGRVLLREQPAVVRQLRATDGVGPETVGQRVERGVVGREHVRAQDRDPLAEERVEQPGQPGPALGAVVGDKVHEPRVVFGVALGFGDLHERVVLGVVPERAGIGQHVHARVQA